MASIVSAGTTSGTALNMSGDTSGVLQLASNNGTTAVTIDTSQNVGIGTASPISTAKTSIKQSAGGGTGSTQLHLEQTNSTDGYDLKCDSADGALAFSRYASGSATERMRIDSSGSVGIGQTSPSSVATKLAVKGNGTSTNTLFSFRNSADSNVLYVREDGWFNLGNASLSPYNNTTGNGANMYIATDSSVQRSTSSLKYKTDVVDARFGLADVLKLRAVNYKSKNPSDGDKVFGGLIAEEVEEAGLTEFVIHAQDGTPDALNYSNMVSLAFKAIQELKAINDTQAKTLTQQTETINALTARVVALESKVGV